MDMTHVNQRIIGPWHWKRGSKASSDVAAENPVETKIQGDEITLRKETHLKVSTPVSSRIVLFKDGNIVLDENGLSSKQFSVTERGVYRVEVYLPQLGKPIGEQPWIISNPIYVR